MSLHLTVALGYITGEQNQKGGGGCYFRGKKNLLAFDVSLNPNNNIMIVGLSKYLSFLNEVSEVLFIGDLTFDWSFSTPKGLRNETLS